MSKLYIDKGGVQVPVASLELISSKEQVVLGSLERDIILRTAGGIKVQIGSKFYDLPISSATESSTIINGSSVTVLDTASDLSTIVNPTDGSLVYVKGDKSFNIAVSGSFIQINKATTGGGSNPGVGDTIFLRFDETQNLSSTQTYQLALNAKTIISSLNDVSSFSSGSCYLGQVIFCINEGKHYQLTSTSQVKSPSSWVELYLSLFTGGKVNAGITIDQNVIGTKTNASLHVIGTHDLGYIPEFYSQTFNGIYVGQNDFSKGVGLWIDDNGDTYVGSSSSTSALRFLTKASSSTPNTVMVLNQNGVGFGGVEPEAGYTMVSGKKAWFKDKVYLDKGITSTVYSSTQGYQLIQAYDNTWGSVWDTYTVRKFISSPLFIDGYTGNGFKLDTNSSSLTVDYLTVRKGVKIYESAIDQLKGINGNLWLTQSVRIESTVENETTFTCNIDSDEVSNLQPFVIGDIIRCQTWTGDNVKYYTAEVVDIDTDTFQWFEINVIDGVDIPVSGDICVRIGNTSDATRRSSVNISGNTINPYIDVLSGVVSEDLDDKIKVRIGALTGIVDADLGTLSGDGLYTNNAYIKGDIVANKLTLGTQLTYTSGVLTIADLETVKNRTISGSSGLTGSGTIFTGNITLTHATGSWTAKTTLTDGEVISNVTVDSYGHITNWSTRTLTTSDIIEGSNQYYTNTKVQTYGNTQYVRLDGNYSDPSWITSLHWNKITNKPSLSSGSIVFSNGLDLSQDNSKLYWDNTNKRLGVGTNVVSNTLEVAGTAKIVGSGSQVPLTLNAASTANNTMVLNHAGNFNAIQLNSNMNLENGVIGWGNNGGGGVSTLSNAFYFITNTVNTPSAKMMFGKYNGSTIVADMTINSSNGYVGIGTNTPTYNLDLRFTSSGGGGKGIHIQNSSSSGYSELIFDNDTPYAGGVGNFVFGYGGTTSNNSNEAYFCQRRNAPLSFWTNNLERMRVSANGNLLIASVTDDNTNKLQVNGGIKSGSITTSSGGELYFGTTKPSRHTNPTAYPVLWIGNSNSGIVGETATGYKGIAMIANLVRDSSLYWVHQDTAMPAWMSTINYDTGNTDAYTIARSIATSGTATLVNLLSIKGNTGNVLIGSLTDNNTHKLQVAGSALFTNDIEISDNSKGVIIKSPNGTRYRIKVADDGTLSSQTV